VTVPNEGESFSCARTFTIDDVRAFADVSRDRGIHRVNSDEDGRLLVRGLLTATIPTKLGGDINYLPQDMTYRFSPPGLHGDEIRCDCRAAKVEDRGDRTYVEFDIQPPPIHGVPAIAKAVSGWGHTSPSPRAVPSTRPTSDRIRTSNSNSWCG